MPYSIGLKGQTEKRSAFLSVFYRLNIYHFVHSGGAEAAGIKISYHSVGKAFDFFISHNGLYHKLHLSAAYSVIGLYFHIAETGKEFSQLSEELVVLIVKDGNFSQDSLLVYVALVYKAHGLNTYSLFSVPGVNTEILQKHISVNSTLNYKSIGKVNFGLFVVHKAKFHIAFHHCFMDIEFW
ncbi:hypothetical protein EVA_04994 [gut metagenome]|uniref:Uncharacterized protein n=1 Tax=gut metagenome TaxID=749906 RepID=J9GHE5_9ZZZZ